MGLFRLGMAGVILLLSGCVSTVVPPVKPSEGLGTITLINGDGSTKCSIYVKRGNFNYQLADMPCKNDNVYKFDLSGLQAGILIKFCDNKDCRKGYVKNGWVYQIKTLKRDSSVTAFDLDLFDGMPVGTVPTQAFKMVESHGNPKQQIHGKLSRVEVKYCTEEDEKPCSADPIDP